MKNFLLLFGRTDDKGIICDQRGVFRVNCMDCLDRTNVVQAALARHIMEQQVNEQTDKQTNYLKALCLCRACTFVLNGAYLGYGFLFSSGQKCLRHSEK